MKSVVRLTDRPYMTLDVYRGRKTTTQQHNLKESCDFFLRTNFTKNTALFTNQGPVVQSIGSLTSSLRGQLVKCFTTL